MRLFITLNTACFIGSIIFSPMIAQARSPSPTGITLSYTRVIIDAADKDGMTYQLINNTDDAILLQARVFAWPQPADDLLISTVEEKNKPQSLGNQAQQSTAKSVPQLPLLIVPPLQRVEPRAQVNLRIRLLEKKLAQLPTDRESLFGLALKAIPSEPQSDSTDTDDNISIKLAVQNNLKVFYRPKGMTKMTATAVSKKLVVTLQGEQLNVRNPTPYYVTFARLSVGDYSLPSQQLTRMVAPFTEQNYNLPINTQGIVRWNTLNDYAEKTPEQHN